MLLEGFDLVTHATQRSILVAFEEFDLTAQFFHSLNGHFLKDSFLIGLQLDVGHFFSLGFVDLIHEVVRIGGLVLHLAQLSVLVAQALNHLVKIDALHEFHLTCHPLKMIQSLHLSLLKLDQLVLLNLLELHFVLEPLKYLVLCGNFVLNRH